jgi:hypothetical protein
LRKKEGLTRALAFLLFFRALLLCLMTCSCLAAAYHLEKPCKRVRKYFPWPSGGLRRETTAIGGKKGEAFSLAQTRTLLAGGQAAFRKVCEKDRDAMPCATLWPHARGWPDHEVLRQISLQQCLFVMVLSY